MPVVIERDTQPTYEQMLTTLLDLPDRADWATVELQTGFVRRKPGVTTLQVPFTQAEVGLIEEAMSANMALANLAIRDGRRGPGLFSRIYREGSRFPVSLGGLVDRKTAIQKIITAGRKAGDAWLSGFAGDEAAMQNALIIRNLPRKLSRLRSTQKS